MALHIVRIAPLISFERSDDRRIPRPHFCIISIRVCFIQQLAASCRNLVFVNTAFGDARNKQFIHAGRSKKPHCVQTPIPHIETSDHAHASGIRRPDRKSRPRHAISRLYMSAKFIKYFVVLSLAKNIAVKICHHRLKLIRVNNFYDIFGRVLNPHPVIFQLIFLFRYLYPEKSEFCIQLFGLCRRFASRIRNPYRLRARPPYDKKLCSFIHMHTEQILGGIQHALIHFFQ